MERMAKEEEEGDKRKKALLESHLKVISDIEKET